MDSGLANQVRVSVTDSTSDVPPHYDSVLTLNLAAATELVLRRAPEAPDVAHNKAVVQIVGYWMDAPPSAAQRFGFNAWLHSGAGAVLGPFIQRRAEAI